MESVVTIQKKLQQLFDALSEIVPLENIHEHPFNLFRSRMCEIEDAIECQIEKSREDKREVEKEIEAIILNIAELRKNIADGASEGTYEPVGCEAIAGGNNYASNDSTAPPTGNGLGNNAEADVLFALKTSEDFKNIYIYKNYLLEAFTQVKIENDRLKSAIDITVQEINGLVGLLYGSCSMNEGERAVVVDYQGSDGIFQGLERLNAGTAADESIPGDLLVSDTISRKRLLLLKKYQGRLQAEVRKKESLRQEIYDKISEMRRKLKVKGEFTREETIYELGELYQRVLKEYLENKGQYMSILTSISEKECVLGEFVQKKDFEKEYSTKYIRLMQEYLEHLEQLQIERFDEIYEQVEGRLREILQIFNITEISADFGNKGIVNQENAANASWCLGKVGRTTQGLEDMRRMISYLEPKKNIYLEISGQIQSRHDLLEKMTEFEKIASDPKRLFKSSFQLITEEKFRKTAYPSLLRIESKLFEDIEQYELEFGEEFFYNGHILRTQLKREIDNRIINRSVFINRCDTPVRKRYRQ